MNVLQIDIYDGDAIPVLYYIEEQCEATCERIYYPVLRLAEDPARVCYWFLYSSFQQTN